LIQDPGAAKTAWLFLKDEMTQEVYLLFPDDFFEPVPTKDGLVWAIIWTACGRNGLCCSTAGPIYNLLLCHSESIEITQLIQSSTQR
jgi:hypothetical protein